MVVFGLLPALTYSAIFLALVLSRRGPDHSTRALVAAVLCTTWTLIGTEGLSLLGALSVGPVFAWWGLGLVLAGAWAWRFRAGVDGAFQRPAPFDWAERGLLAAIAFLLGSALVSALLSPPNNYDTLTYHMARQLYWIQYESLAHYPSNSLRQLFMPPLAEFWGVNLYLLADGDRWANIVQWSAFALGAVAVAQLAGSMGAGRRGRLIAAFLATSNPMAWLNGASPKNDLLVALWVLCVAVFGLNVVRQRRCTWGDAVLIGWTVGLLALTKGTAAVFALPVCLIVGGVILWTERVRALALGAVIVVGALVPSLGHFHRNYTMFGNPSGPVEPKNEGTSLYTNQSHTLGDLTSNIIRNVTLHLGMPSKEWNSWLQEKSYSLHESLGLDPNKEPITWKRMPYKVQYLPGSENNAGAFIHFLLSLIIPFWAWRRVADDPDVQRKWVVRAWTVVPLIGFVLFCAVFRWQPWHSRLHIPIFGLLAPLAGLCLERGRIARFLAPAMVVAALAWFVPAMPNVTRPMWGKHDIFSTPRVDQRFSVRRQWIASSKLMVDVAKRIDAHEVGFHMGHNEYQHPLMHMLRYQVGKHVRFVNVNAKAVSNPEGIKYTPDMVVRTRSKWHELLVGGTPYVSVARRGIHTAYVHPDKLAGAPDDHGSAVFYGWRSMTGIRKPGHGIRTMSSNKALLKYRHFRATDLMVTVEVKNPRKDAVVLAFVRKGEVLARFNLAPGQTRTEHIRLPARRGTDVLQVVGKKGLKFTQLRTSPWRSDLYAAKEAPK